MICSAENRLSFEGFAWTKEAYPEVFNSDNYRAPVKHETHHFIPTLFLNKLLLQNTYFATFLENFCSFSQLFFSLALTTTFSMLQSLTKN